ncbi:uncharacterized protein LOC122255783 [Penaeus japonicus]|uniref:uncharacterized protein LOC122253002 n=1 Tax=Penaeus japonicus TaxID=27405 RepID=UPI001C70F969|nr:uncharacterized protein LOC122253002 [Penaeus japonicus]XP_042876009.1 uncharacterized protein LOC122255783 [Penaeus japonicus]
MCRSSVFIVLGLVVMVAAVTQARYLPTRADDSRLDEIRELIRELLERTAEGGNNRMMGNSGYEKRYLFKRSAIPEGNSNSNINSNSKISNLVGGEVATPLINLPQ